MMINPSIDLYFGYNDWFREVRLAESGWLSFFVVAVWSGRVLSIFLVENWLKIYMLVGFLGIWVATYVGGQKCSQDFFRAWGCQIQTFEIKKSKNMNHISPATHTNPNPKSTRLKTENEHRYTSRREIQTRICE
jgi:hypothetical protein